MAVARNVRQPNVFRWDEPKFGHSEWQLTSNGPCGFPLAAKDYGALSFFVECHRFARGLYSRNSRQEQRRFHPSHCALAPAGQAMLVQAVLCRSPSKDRSRRILETTQICESKKEIKQFVVQTGRHIQIRLLGQNARKQLTKAMKETLRTTDSMKLRRCL